MKQQFLISLIACILFLLIQLTGCGKSGTLDIKGERNDTAVGELTANSNVEHSGYPDQKIIYLHCQYGSFFGGDYNFTLVLEDDDTVLFTAEGSNGVDMDVSGARLPASVMDEIANLVEENGIKHWNGFYESDINILDGHSFDLTIHYEDGDKLTAYGYMIYPEGYSEAFPVLAGFLEQLAAQEYSIDAGPIGKAR